MMLRLSLVTSFGVILTAQTATTPAFHEAYVNALQNFIGGVGGAKASSLNETAQTSMDQLEESIAHLTDVKAAIDKAWPKASDAQKGNFAGAAVSMERYVLATAGGIMGQLGCSAPKNPTAAPNYYSESSDLAVLDARLGDTTGYLMGTKQCIPQDQKQSKTSKVLHSQAVGIASGLHTEFWGKGKRDRAKMQDRMLAQMTGTLPSATAALGQYLPPGASQPEAKRVLGTREAAAAVPAAPPAPVAAGKAGDFPAGVGLPVLHTNRVPDAGCHWEPYVNHEVGVALLVELCTGSDTSRSTATQNLVAAYNVGKQGEITVFTKPAAQPIEQAIRQQAITKLSPGAKAACHAVPSKDDVLASKWKWYTLTATTGPLAKKESPQEIVDLPCSPWEDMDAALDFVYQPAQSKTKFLFVALGQEAPSWDVESIEFLDGK